ncbi:MAG: nucleoside deaminase [Myxococcales bacterium]|nr:nucleoside deaminase [Myxococcales bacterium]MCB9734300.1 nucleoside deaminase [Deltaproteobacteria bacterium]
MDEALALAEDATAMGNVPVGALVVVDGAVIARAVNLREILQDPTAHAEVLALSAAAQKLGRWRLEDATLYVTLEPCAMCAGAIAQARVGRLVFAALEPKTGGVCSVHRIVPEGVTQVTRLDGHAPRSVALLQRFFEALRARDGKNGGSQWGEVAELVEGA